MLNEVECPKCYRWVDWDSDEHEKGEIINCPDCGAFIAENEKFKASVKKRKKA